MYLNIVGGGKEKNLCLPSIKFDVRWLGRVVTCTKRVNFEHSLFISRMISSCIYHYCNCRKFLWLSIFVCISKDRYRYIHLAPIILFDSTLAILLSGRFISVRIKPIKWF